MADNAKDSSFSDYQARERAIAIGKRYINIFHQLHVIKAGLAVLNREFIALPEDAVEIMKELSGGQKLRQHIINLKDGTTPMDKIDPDLLPFGGEVFEDKALLEKYTAHASAGISAPKPAKRPKPAIDAEPAAKAAEPNKLEGENAAVIFEMLREYKNTPKDLEAFKAREEVKDFGPEWKAKIADIIAGARVVDKAQLKKTFDGLCIFDYALNIWQEASEIVKNPKQVKKDGLKSRLAEYKKYLSMFGAGGKSLYDRVEAVANG
ncbi:MAG: hypothetical protein LBO78_00620 [Rickettsiales bacterium]|jgi:hypothetical protein|nr:hypothetical protein [Rickettsiales bacterium]